MSAESDTEFHARCAALMGNVTPAQVAEMVASEGRYKKALTTILKGSGCLVFLDGRNEHGTHILPGSFGSVDWMEHEKIELAEDAGFTEAVFKEAEESGFKAGEWVWLDWRHDSGQYGNEGQCEIAPYWEYIGVNKEISEIVRESFGAAMEGSK